MSGRKLGPFLDSLVHLTILHDVSDCTTAVEVAASAFCATCFGHCDLVLSAILMGFTG